jgi:hypothetical protein
MKLNTDTMNVFLFSIYLILPAAYGPEVDSAPNRNEYQKTFLRYSTADNLTAICKRIV